MITNTGSSITTNSIISNTDFVKPSPPKKHRVSASESNSSQTNKSLASFIPQDVSSKPKSTAPNGKFTFADSEEQKQLIIDQLQDQYKDSPVIRINSLEDLQKYDLSFRVQISDGRLRSDVGRLFTTESIVLVIDLTHFKPAEMASINELLQSTPTFDKKPLGERVQRYCLVNEAMLQGDQPTTPDLWRRILTMEQVTDFAKASFAPTLTDAQLLKECTAHTPSSHTIDIRVNKENWQHQLFGGIDISSSGELIHCDGILATLSDSTQLVLHDAPTDDPAFVHALANAVRTGKYYTVNGDETLANDISLVFKFTANESINESKQQWQSNNEHFDSTKPYALLDECSFELLNNYQIIQGKVIKQNPLRPLLHNCDQLVIEDGQWSHEQWVRLNQYIADLQEEHDVKPTVFLDPPIMDWEPLNTNSAPWKEALDYQVSVSDSEDSLQYISLEDPAQLLFRVEDTPLLTTIRSGQPVRFLDVNHNPTFASLLKTLSLPHPYLLLNGKKIAMPGVQISCCESVPQTTFKTEALNHLYRILKNPKYDSAFPINAHQIMEGDFEQRFEQLAHDIQQRDRSETLKPYHQRQALNILLLKSFRDHPELHGFLSCIVRHHFFDLSDGRTVNRSALARFIQQHPEFTAQDVKTHFWSLMRYCPLIWLDRELLKNSNFVDGIDDKAVETVYYALSLTSGMILDSTHSDNLRKLLRSAFLVTKHQLKPGSSIHELSQQMTNEIEPFLEQKDKASIEEVISKCYQENQLPESLTELPQLLLLTEEPCHQLHYQKRIALVIERLQQTKAISFRGEAGSGKTHLALAAAKQFGNGQHLFLQLQKHTTASELYGSVQNNLNNSQDVPNGHFKEGPILQWALSKEPPLLILDEADLAQEGLLAPLSGLWQTPPVLSFQGRQYPLTPRHCIIFTGNGSLYEGRQFDKALHTHVPEHYIPPLSKGVLRSLIVEPTLPAVLLDSQKKHMTNQVITLFEQIGNMASGFHYTPRDLQDVVSLIAHYTEGHGESLTEAQSNSVVWKACEDVIRSLLNPEQQNDLYALNCWFHANNETDASVLASSKQAFETFFTTLKEQHCDLQLNVPAIKNYVEQLWLRLKTQNHSRPCMLIEGPAGWGKDEILERVLNVWFADQGEKHWQRLNANPAQWQSLLDAVEYAQRHGQILIVSELNIIDPALIDSLFNSILTKDHKPGFQLFLTMNAAGQAGRQVLSKAFINRSFRLILSNLSLKAKQQLIVEQTKNENLAKWLAVQLHQYQQRLTEQNSPLAITTQDVITLAAALYCIHPSQYDTVLKERIPYHTKALQHPLLPMTDYEQIIDKQAVRSTKLHNYTELANAKQRSIAIAVSYGHRETIEKQRIIIAEQTSDTSFYILNQSHDDKPVVTNKTVGFKSDLTSHQSFQLTYYFQDAAFNPSLYRKKFDHVELTEDDLYEQTFIIDRSSISMIAKIDNGYYKKHNIHEFAEADQLIKSYPFSCIISQQWTTLPCLSDHDELVELSVDSDETVELGRNEQTGQLLVRTVSDKSLDVKIDFTIKPRRAYFTSTTYFESIDEIKTIDDLASSEIKNFMTTYIYADIIDERLLPFKDLNDIPLPHRLIKLQTLLSTFGNERNLRCEGRDGLLESMLYRLGVCWHLASIYHLFCNYWGVPSRIVSDGVSHSFVEISTDGKQSWLMVDLNYKNHIEYSITYTNDMPIKSNYFVNRLLASGISDASWIVDGCDLPLVFTEECTESIKSLFKTIHAAFPEMALFYAMRVGSKNKQGRLAFYKIQVDNIFKMLVHPHINFLPNWRTEEGRNLLNYGLELFSQSASSDIKEIIVKIANQTISCFTKGAHYVEQLAHLHKCAQKSEILNRANYEKLNHLANYYPELTQTMKANPNPKPKAILGNMTYYPFHESEEDSENICQLSQGENGILSTLLCNTIIFKRYTHKVSSTSQLNIKRLCSGEPAFYQYQMVKNYPHHLVIDLNIINSEIESTYFLRKSFHAEGIDKHRSFLHWLKSQYLEGTRWYWVYTGYEQYTVQTEKNDQHIDLVRLDYYELCDVLHWPIIAEPDELRAALDAPSNAKVLTRAELHTLAKAFLVQLETEA